VKDDHNERCRSRTVTIPTRKNECTPLWRLLPFCFAPWVDRFFSSILQLPLSLIVAISLASSYMPSSINEPPGILPLVCDWATISYVLRAGPRATSWSWCDRREQLRRAPITRQLNPCERERSRQATFLFGTGYSFFLKKGRIPPSSPFLSEAAQRTATRREGIQQPPTLSALL
jgi:hypothetical protein